MIKFDGLTLSALIEELCPELVGGRVHKVQQPSKYEILLTLRAQAKNRKLLISAHPTYSYIAVLDHSKREFVNPHQPPMFCMLLRKHMEGAKIVDIKQPENERILEIYFESFNELGDKVLMTLACEIMGKYSNVILYVTGTKLILGCAHNVGELMSSQRELAGSLPYVLPPAQKKRDILSVSVHQFIDMSMALNETVDKWLNKRFYNISLALARELCKASGVHFDAEQSSLNTVENMQKLYFLTTELFEKKNFKPSLSADKKFYSLAAVDPDVSWRAAGSVNEMVDRYFYHHIIFDSMKQVKSNLKARVKREVKRINNKIAKLEETLSKAYTADEYRIKADILTANIHQVKPGLSEIILEDFYNNNDSVKITLDPRMSASQNVQRYYKLYNKAKNSLDITLKRKEQELAEIKYLNSIQVSIEQAQDLKTLDEIQEEINNQYKSQNIKKNQQKLKQKPKINVLKFISSNNLEILVGRNNKQNDFLISKLAHPADMWLHTQIAHGSHVLIKTDRGKLEILEQTLHEAALLAGYYSEARFSSSVNVVYTLKKFVKKPAGAMPGFVVYSNEKTLYVNPLEEHVAPILEKMVEE